MIMRNQIVHSDPRILSGTPVFAGTRLPAQTLFDSLEGGETLDEFLNQFPTVTRQQALAALEVARESLLAVRVLLDENLPADLATLLPGQEVKTVGHIELGHQ